MRRWGRQHRKARIGGDVSTVSVLWQQWRGPRQETVAGGDAHANGTGRGGAVLQAAHGRGERRVALDEHLAAPLAQSWIGEWSARERPSVLDALQFGLGGSLDQSLLGQPSSAEADAAAPAAGATAGATAGTTAGTRRRAGRGAGILGDASSTDGGGAFVLTGGSNIRWRPSVKVPPPRQPAAALPPLHSWAPSLLPPAMHHVPRVVGAPQPIGCANEVLSRVQPRAPSRAMNMAVKSKPESSSAPFCAGGAYVHRNAVRTNLWRRHR